MTTAAVRQRTVSLDVQGQISSAPWPYFEADEIEAATAVLRSGKVNYWTGQEGRLFETEFARSTGTKYAVCVANGTVALELALQALGIGRGDEVITPARTFIASASCIAMRGARPICVDVDPESQNMTAETIHRAITPRTKAIIAVHLAGWPCEMDEILDLAAKHNLHVIEDCAQAQGGKYKGRPVGSMGTVAAFSFCQDKIMTTAGEGGMFTTNDPALWERAWSFKDHGKSYDAVYNRQHPPGFRWLHESFGTNWRMTEIQAALGRIALTKVPQWVETRRRNADTLNKALSRLPGLRIPVVPDIIHHAYYKFYAFLRPEMIRDGWNRNAIMQAIQAAGVPCFAGSCSEIYLEKAFVSGRKRPRLPVAKALGETSLMFLVHPTLSEGHMAAACETIEMVMAVALKGGSISSGRPLARAASNGA
jgi:dTDP-4-amino-4,6-dideoxygalactose transaminase